MKSIERINKPNFIFSLCTQAKLFCLSAPMNSGEVNISKDLLWRKRERA